jgi:Rrf2 family protein
VDDHVWPPAPDQFRDAVSHRRSDPPGEDRRHRDEHALASRDRRHVRQPLEHLADGRGTHHLVPESCPDDDRRDRRASRDDDLVAAISRRTREWEQREQVADGWCRGEEDSHQHIVAYRARRSLTLPAPGRRLNPDEITRISRTDPLTQPVTTVLRPVYHGSGAVSFSTKGEYGVRLMVHLARHFGTGPASLAGIAAEEDLPRAYLEQLVVSLREAGLVVSTRGAHGGYELARSPEAITMSEVLRALEGPIAPMFCATDDPEHALICDRASRCTVNLLWVRVRDAITTTLESMTLADLAPPRVVAPETPRPQGVLTTP